eukprot:COSAG01_NODE_271_length_19794_cov_73.630890_1_plen_121_part_00
MSWHAAAAGSSSSSRALFILHRLHDVLVGYPTFKYYDCTVHGRLRGRSQQALTKKHDTIGSQRSQYVTMWGKTIYWSIKKLYVFIGQNFADVGKDYQPTDVAFCWSFACLLLSLLSLLLS